MAPAREQRREQPAGHTTGAARPEGAVTGDQHGMQVDTAAGSQATDERAIVDRARSGDRAALGELYDLYLTPIYRYVLARVGSTGEAEDLTEEVFLKVIEHIGRFEWQDVPFSAWIFRIARNQVISHHRKHGGKTAGVSADSLELEDHTPGPDHLVEQQLLLRDVYAACEQLPELQRQIVSLRFAAGLSVRETADTLGRTENTVKVLQHKAIAKLQKLLGQR